jgi:hypothetical protein
MQVYVAASAFDAAEEGDLGFELGAEIGECAGQAETSITR